MTFYARIFLLLKPREAWCVFVSTSWKEVGQRWALGNGKVLHILFPWKIISSLQRCLFFGVFILITDENINVFKWLLLWSGYEMSSKGSACFPVKHCCQAGLLRSDWIMTSSTDEFIIDGIIGWKQKMGPIWREWVMGDVTSGTVFSLSCPACLSSSSWAALQQFFHHTLPPWCFCFTTTKSADRELKHLKLWAKITPSFHHSDRKLTNTVPI